MALSTEGHCKSADFQLCFAAKHAVWRLGCELAAYFSAEHRAPYVAAADRTNQNRQAERILATYGNSILRLAYSYLHNMSDAQDVLQEALISLIQAAPVFENESHEKAWLLRVAANICKNKTRYNKIRMTDELDEKLIADNQADLSFVWSAVKALPQKYREVIHLYYHEGYSSDEIAEILHKNKSTVRSDLRRGRARLKEILKEAYDFEEIV